MLAFFQEIKGGPDLTDEQDIKSGTISILLHVIVSLSLIFCFLSACCY